MTLSNSHSKPVFTSGALAFLNPTTKYHAISPPPPPGPVTGEKPTAEVAYHVWRSRDNRKGRHAAVITRGGLDEKRHRPTNSFPEIARGVAKLLTRYPVWDVSYDVATVFTLGSVVWVINGFFVWYPLAAPSSEFPGESDTWGGWTAIIGATIFEIGSILLMLEAVNENRTDCFGWALESALEDHSLRLHATPNSCRHHHCNKRSWLRHNATVAPGELTAALTVPQVNGTADFDTPASSPSHKPNPKSKLSPRRWSWWPTWYELKTHYLREIAFHACLSQTVGATIFWISGFTALEPINSALSTPALNGAYWLPQVVGGTGFIISSLLFMLEVQTKWYLPAPSLLGWHVGFWNLIGAIGFTLCGALGFAASDPSVEYALTLSTFVGSWAFLIGSVVQWYESLDKYPLSSVEHVPSSSHRSQT